MFKIYTLYKPIKGFKDYKIDPDGVVRNIHGKQLNKPRDPKNLYIITEPQKEGYYKCTLSKKGKRYTRLIHRLVAEAFVPNPDNKKYVRHINKDIHDNRSQNLEWVTALELRLKTMAVKPGRRRNLRQKQKEKLYKSVQPLCSSSLNLSK